MNMDIYSQYLPNFLLILLRASIFMSLLPFFGGKNFPSMYKIGLAIAISLMLTPIVQIDAKDMSIPLLVMREVMFGIVLGGAMRVILFAVETSGQLMSNTMGLSIATTFNPEMGQSTEVARFYGIIAMLMLLSMDAHHDLIYIFVKSYEWVPVGNIDMKDLILRRIVGGGGTLFILALKFSAPVVVGVLVSNLLLGLIYKAVPQINIFFISFPIYIFVGFLIMLISLPVFMYVFSANFGDIRNNMFRIIELARG